MAITRFAVSSKEINMLGQKNIMNLNSTSNEAQFAGFKDPLERQLRAVAGSIVLVFTTLALVMNIWFIIMSLFVGAMLIISAVTSFCPMIHLLAVMPWNRKNDQK